MSGMRSWIGRMSSLAAVVTMVEVSKGSLLSGLCQRSHNPAKAIGALSRRRMSDCDRGQAGCPGLSAGA